jgi:membrane associated rhomboid family serine protease
MVGFPEHAIFAGKCRIAGVRVSAQPALLTDQFAVMKEPPLLSHLLPHVQGYQVRPRLRWVDQLMFVVGMPVETRQSTTLRAPWAVHGLALVITLATLGYWAVAGLPGWWHAAVFVPRAEGLRWWTGLFGYALLHGGWLHLFGNLYFLTIFGDNTECVFGRRRTLGLFLVASVAGALLHGAVTGMPLIGASAGVMGVMVFYVLQFPHARILWLPIGWLLRVGLWYSLGRKLERGFPVLGFFALYLALDLVNLHAQLFGGGRVSALAHLGGGATGALIWLAWRRGWLP